MAMIGADVAQLQQLAVFFESTGSTLDSMRTRIDRLLHTTNWTGTDRDNSLAQWTNVGQVAMKSTTAHLHSSGAALRKQATEQQTASDPNGGGIGPAAGLLGSVAAAQPHADLGGTNTWEDRGPWAPSAGTSEGVGRDVLARALNDAGDPNRIAEDEIEIVKLANGKYVVILPGVTDLSLTKSPLGLNPDHRSVRDIDYGAWNSADNTSANSNVYAQYVRDAMQAAGVPVGADVMLVGHSYGADTAIDLAANRDFNGGPNGYNVTHALAAGYANQYDFAAVPGSTKVLAIQNHADAVVAAERMVAGPRLLVDGASDLGNGAGDRNLQKFERGVAKMVIGSAKTVIDTKPPIENAMRDVTAAAATRTPFPLLHLAQNPYSSRIGTSVSDNGQANIVFRGGWDGFGHGIPNYVGFVANGDTPELKAFVRSVAERGYGAPGTSTAHDVSVRQ